ncbi:hypothetical protein JN11_00888 [Mucilaginibacter frigoritolerans]|uniref:Uncharacterized protein n=1 Tax=Mucilaginibacter frigoritolerans TaxID=652788 RepID=A0A562UC05_9SPHI|nr:hypothetical protein JN11_00888 [Mucilaginibacter frigoritolerans]
MYDSKINLVIKIENQGIKLHNPLFEVYKSNNYARKPQPTHKINP